MDHDTSWPSFTSSSCTLTALVLGFFPSMSATTGSTVFSHKPGLQPRRAALSPERSAAAPTAPHQQRRRLHLLQHQRLRQKQGQKSRQHATRRSTREQRHTCLHESSRAAFFVLDTGMWRSIAMCIVPRPAAMSSAVRLRRRSDQQSPRS